LCEDLEVVKIAILFHRDSAVRDAMQQVFTSNDLLHDHDVYFQVVRGVDVALMDDSLDVGEVRSITQARSVGILDPKMVGKRGKENIAAADFSVVSSLEQQVAIQSLNSTSFIFPWSIATVESQILAAAQNSDLIRVGYHGNRQHLDSMYKTVSPALESLSGLIEFVAIYNIAGTGRWRRGRPKGIPIFDIQWDRSDWLSHIASLDVGIVPNLLPSRRIEWPNPLASRLGQIGLNLSGRNRNDFVTRFKFTSNINRIYPFVAMGVPVVADLIPSAATVIRSGESGFLAYDSKSWEYALRTLATSADTRSRMANRAWREWPKHLDRNLLRRNFISWLEERCA